MLAELALSLVASSLAILELLAPAASLSALLIVAVAVWAVLITDLATRDYQADTKHLSGATGGVNGR